jgi:two-component system, chemotaxis family, CheB/CheR fusion protein
MDDRNDSPSVPVNDPTTLPSQLGFPVVGLGASAGGLQALKRFLEHLPADSGMAFVVILHLSPKHESNVDRILERSTRMPVQQVDSATSIEKNHVYVISPRHQLLMTDGHLRVTDAKRPVGQHVAIDLFFRTLADAHRERAIGVVLSGTGGDGAMGLRRIKEQGGVSIAQSPDDCEHDSMPLNAIAAGVVDFVLPVADIPQKLIELCRTAASIRLPPASAPDRPNASDRPLSPERLLASEESLRDILDCLRVRSGHDFRHYKRATVLRRIERRLQVNGLTDLPAYRDFLQENPAEATGLLKDMLIGVTHFFRDREVFEAVERDVIPPLFKGKSARDPVRVWSAACASGEEAYSLAILLSEHAATLPEPPPIQVFGTDIDSNAIATARAGVYPASIVIDVPPSLLRQYFSQEQERYRVAKPVRDRVLFALHDLLRDPPFSRLDMICCRNLLIYLDRDVQRRVLELFHFALNPGGVLLLGSSESAEVASAHFAPIDKKNRIFRAIAGGRSMRPATLPLDRYGGRDPVLHPPASEKKRRFTIADVHQRVLEQYASPSVLVNHELSIVHSSEHAGRFLRYAAGEPSNNLINAVLPELRLDLRTVLFQAIQAGKSCETRRVQIRREDNVSYVTMVARPFRDPEVNADFVLVLFDEVEDTMSAEAKAPRDDARDNAVAQLEAELTRTKEHLQATIEQSESSTEELRASNEELQAINEELRSATEELETSKEELQSVNEELSTVNHELKLKIDETSKANDDLQNLIAATDIATVFVDGKLSIKRFTPRATDIFNIIPSDIGRSLLDITHRMDYRRLTDDAAQVFETLRLVEREVRSIDGKYYLARLLPYRTTEHHIEGAVLTFIDITSRRQAEERLRVGEEQMWLTEGGSSDYGIITLDDDGRVTSWNRGAERMFGYLEPEMIGRSLEMTLCAEHHDAALLHKEMQQARDEGRSEQECWLQHRDGGRFRAVVATTPLQRDGLHGYARIVHDLVSRRRQPLKGAEAPTVHQVDAEAASALKHEFLAVMSHELKNPLNLININVEILAALPELHSLPIATRCVQVIRQSVFGQAKIIDDLLDLSRMRTGKLTLSRCAVDVAGVLDELVDVAQADALTSDVDIHVDACGEPLTVFADPVRLEQIIWNLLGNAMKFTPSGGRITLRLGREGASARLDVIDTGQGIDPEFLPRVFDMFGQAEGQSVRNRGGLGIGLALVRQLVELHEGRLEVASRGVGHGSRFSVWLPLLAESGASPALGSASADGQPLAGVSVLVVDDMPDTVDSFRQLLEFLGATVRSATSGKAALALLHDSPCDLLLSDIGMPDMDGYQLIQAVRKHPPLATVPAIAISGYGRPNDVRMALDSGFDAHLSKPVFMDPLLAAIRRVRLQRADATSGPTEQS